MSRTLFLLLLLFFLVGFSVGVFVALGMVRG